MSHTDELVRAFIELTEAEQKLDAVRQRYGALTGTPLDHRWPTVGMLEEMLADERPLKAELAAKEHAYRRMVSGLGRVADLN